MMPVSPASAGCSKARSTSPNDSFTAPIPAETTITSNSSNAGTARVEKAFGRARVVIAVSSFRLQGELHSGAEGKGQRRIAKRFVVVLVEQVAHGCIRRSPAW